MNVSSLARITVNVPEIAPQMELVSPEKVTFFATVLGVSRIPKSSSGSQFNVVFTVDHRNPNQSTILEGSSFQKIFEKKHTPYHGDIDLRVLDCGVGKNGIGAQTHIETKREDSRLFLTLS